MVPPPHTHAHPPLSSPVCRAALLLVQLMLTTDAHIPMTPCVAKAPSTRPDRKKLSASARGSCSSMRPRGCCTSRPITRQRRRHRPRSTGPRSGWSGSRDTASFTTRSWHLRTAVHCCGGTATTSPNAAPRRTRACRSPTLTRPWSGATCGTTTGPRMASYVRLYECTLRVAGLENLQDLVGRLYSGVLIYFLIPIKV